MTSLFFDFAADARYALRTWRRQPVFVAVALISLAAGIGLNTAVFSIINTIFFQSIRGVPEPGRVVTIGGRSSYVAFREVRDHSGTLGGVAAWQPLGVEIRYRGLAIRRVVPAVSDGYFSTLRVQPAKGRFFVTAPARQPASVAEAVLDHEFWTETLNADPGVIGEPILIYGRTATIVGIAPAAFHGFGPVRPPLWISMDMKPAVMSAAAEWESPNESGWRIIGRLKPDVTAGETNAELRVLTARSPSLFPDGPLRASAGREGWSGPVSAEKHIEFLLIVVLPLAIVGLILWIGCSNVANLLLARASARRKEIAIRFANGASRPRVIRLLLTEGLLLSFGGGALGMIVAIWTIDFVWATLPDVPRLAVELDGNVLVYTSLVCIAATILFGLAPALHGTRVEVAPLLKGEAGAHADSRRGARLRRFFLVTQFACSMTLLVVAGTFVRTVIATYLGEQSAVVDRLTVAYLESRESSGAARRAHWENVRNELQRMPQVISVTLAPPGNGSRAPLLSQGLDTAALPTTVAVQFVDAGYLRTTATALIAGREDLWNAASTVEQVLVNERAAAQIWKTADVTGKRFSLGDVAILQIAGVVRDHWVEPRVLRLARYEDMTSASVMVRTSAPAGDVIGTLRAVFHRLSADRAFTRVSTFRDAGLGPLQRLTRMAVIVALLVLSLATIGLYGSVSFITSQRTREIAIRLAVGAPRAAMLRLLVREGVFVVAGGSALGFALTAVAFRFMSGMIFARWTLDPVTVAGVLFTFSIVTLGACYLPGRRAARIDPMTVLRAE